MLQIASALFPQKNALQAANFRISQLRLSPFGATRNDANTNKL